MVLRIIPLLLLVIVFACPLPVRAADLAAEAPPTAEKKPPVFPGLSELGPRATALADFVAKSEDQLRQLADTTRLESSLAEYREQAEKILAEMEALGNPDDWYVDRLNRFLGQYAQLRQRLEGLQNRLTGWQQELEVIQEQSRQDANFWTEWTRELKKQGLVLPEQTFIQAKQQLNQLDESLKQTSAKLLQVQERAGVLQREIISSSDRLALAQEKLRKTTFRKNALSFLTPDFYRQFNSKLWGQVKEGVAAALKFNLTYLQDNLWLFGLMLVTLISITTLIGRHRSQFQETEDWQFFLAHPLAAGSFTAVIAFGFWLSSPPPLFRFVLLAWTVVAATTLTVALLPSRRQTSVLRMAAGVFLLNSVFEMIALPQPLLRLYVALLAVIFIPLLIRYIRYSIHSGRVLRGSFYRAVLRLAIVVLGLSFVAQAAGYMNFSVWLLNATFDTVLIIVFAQMTLRLSGGGIEFLIGLLSKSGNDFFTQFGNELVLRSKRLLKVLTISITLFYLLPVWRLFSSVGEGWDALTEWSFSLGDFNVSLQMLLMAGVAFYLALQISWLLQGMSETQIFSSRPVDRGVRDAIKKLIHYGIVLFGFLTALRILGFGLQNFVVLLGAFGVGIGFGLQDIVNNFLSGLILLFERPIKVGDGVVIDGEYGVVVRIGMRSTVVQNLDEAELIVPNSHMISQKVTNWTLSNRRVRVVVPVGVAYGSNLETVLAVLTEAGEQHPEVLKKPKPSPFFVQFGGSSLDFELRVWISNVDNRPRIKNELLLFIDKRFREEEIEIPFSQHDLHLRSVSPGILPGGQE